MYHRLAEIGLVACFVLSPELLLHPCQRRSCKMRSNRTCGHPPPLRATSVAACAVVTHKCSIAYCSFFSQLRLFRIDGYAEEPKYLEVDVSTVSSGLTGSRYKVSAGVMVVDAGTMRVATEASSCRRRRDSLGSRAPNDIIKTQMTTITSEPVPAAEIKREGGTPQF